MRQVHSANFSSFLCYAIGDEIQKFLREKRISNYGQERSMKAILKCSNIWRWIKIIIEVSNVGVFRCGKLEIKGGRAKNYTKGFKDARHFLLLARLQTTMFIGA